MALALEPETVDMVFAMRKVNTGRLTLKAKTMRTSREPLERLFFYGIKRNVP